jgi:glycosyltransferase involved in cell wall biosynthesis
VKISAVIIAGNEEQKIADAVRSVDWADEILVIDSESTDRTREIAEALGARVIVRPWPGFAAQKQFGVEQAENDWIFSLDADERVSPGLRAEILSVKEGRYLSAQGYKMRRLANYCGKPIRHCGWYPDWQLRLFDRTKGRWKDVLIHESFQMKHAAHVERLRSPIIHLTVDSIEEHRRMIETRYAPLAAEQMFANGRRTSPVQAAAAGPISFVETYLLKLGFLDGREGYGISRLAGYHAALKHRLLLEMQRRQEHKP